MKKDGHVTCVAVYRAAWMDASQKGTWETRQEDMLRTKQAVMRA